MAPERREQYTFPPLFSGEYYVMLMSSDSKLLGESLRLAQLAQFSNVFA